MIEEIKIEVINGNGKKSASKFVHTLDPEDLEGITREKDNVVLRFGGTTITFPSWFCKKVSDATKEGL